MGGFEVDGRCWARVLGGCSGTVSGEHLFAHCTLGERTTLSGSWFATPLELPSVDAKWKILCGRHNSALSPYDTAAGQFVRAVEQANAQQLKRTEMAVGERAVRPELYEGDRRIRAWKAKTSKSVNRLKFERYLTKTAINVAVVGRARLIHSGGARQPSRELVEYVFGLRDKPEYLEFAMVRATGDKYDFGRKHGCVFIDGEVGTPPADMTAAALIRKSTWTFLVSFVGTGIPKGTLAEVMDAPSVDVLHLGGLNFSVAKQVWHTVRFMPPAEKWAKPFPA